MEFWALHPDELWWLIDARRPPKMYGSLREDEVADIVADLKKGGYKLG